MSSELEGVALLAGAVVLPAAVAFGAGWLAWQAGKSLLDLNASVDRANAEKLRQLREAQKQRERVAQAGYEQLMAMCQGVLSELAQAEDSVENVTLRTELQQLCKQSPPADPARLERVTAAGLAQLERIVQRKSKLQEVQLFESGAYRGLSLADLMDDLRLAVAAAEIAEKSGADVRAADPAALERAEWNERLSNVAARVMTALEFVVDLSQNYGLSQANNAWFRSCFNGVDERIGVLCAPTTSNAELKKGVRSLEEVMEQYDMLRPGLEREVQELAALYPVYVQAAQALGEPVHAQRHFKSAEALEVELRRFESRARRAEVCAEIYQKLGPAAYLCYAWDEELRAMGYAVHTRKKIAEMADYRPERAKLDGAEMPFYQWDEQALTQLYRIAPQCDLQLIVHPDGSITMQTIAGTQDGTEAVQKSHCDKMKTLRQRLRDNWFIAYDAEETAGAEIIRGLEAWRSQEENVWARQAAEQARTVPAAGVRENTRTESQKTMRKE